LILGLGVTVGAASLLVVGCGSDDTEPGNTPSTQTCAPTGECAAIKSDCLALVDNTGKTDKIGLRMAQLAITKPVELAKGAVKAIVGNGVAMNLDQCNIQGQGTFSWLLEFDTTNGKLKTGGAKPVTDPWAGYCFVNETANNITPITVDAPFTAGKFETTGDVSLTVPIYLDAAASTVVLLPLQGVKISNATLSADNNCIGKYNADTLSVDNNCLPDAEAGINYFTDDASLQGYVTLEQADTVDVSALGQSLCVLLSGDAKTYGVDVGDVKRCTRDANNKIILKGDWCSTSNTAATTDCADAFQLGATFAASAVKISGDCQ
jgi:hypothetical protein